MQRLDDLCDVFVIRACLVIRGFFRGNTLHYIKIIEFNTKSEDLSLLHVLVKQLKTELNSLKFLNQLSRNSNKTCRL